MKDSIAYLFSEGGPLDGYFTWFGGIPAKAGDDLDFFIMYFNDPNNQNVDILSTVEDSIVWVFSENGISEAERIAQDIAH